MTSAQHSVVKHTLDDIARRHIADSVNLWPQIQAHLSHQKATKSMRPARLVWTIVLVIVAALIITTVAYALYRVMADPGLQAVHDAGLVTDLNLAATPAPIEPVVMPSAISAASSPARSIPTVQPVPTATAMAAQQVGDVIVTLNWAYADESRVALGLTIGGLQPQAGVKAHFLINSITLSDDRGTLFGRDGASQATDMRPDEPGVVEVAVINYQPLTAHQTLHLKVDIKLGDTTVPVIMPGNMPAPGPVPMATIAPLGDFHFQFDLPVYPALIIKPDQSTTANGLTIRLEEIRLTPSYAEARLCYELPDPADWLIESHLQIGQSPAVPQTAIRLAVDKADLTNGGDERCALISYPASYLRSAGPITLTLDSLHTSLPEVIPAEVVRQANEELAARGIEFEYIMMDHGARLTIKRKPAAISKTEANQLALQALEQAAAKSVVGPWVFIVRANQVSR
jgi:hypothetical protein